MTYIDPLSGPTWQQPDETDPDFAYRHAYRYAYGNRQPVPQRHAFSHAYAEYTRRRFVADPSLMGTWDHSREFPNYLNEIGMRS